MRREKIAGRTIALLCLLLLTFITITAGEALAADLDISISASKNRVGMRDTVRLEVLISGGSGSVSEPQISGINEFEILGKSYGERISIVNMSVTKSKTYVYTLRPLSYGQKIKLRASVTSRGKTHSSNELEIEMVKSGGGSTGNLPQPRASVPPPPGGGLFGLDDDFGGVFNRKRFRRDDFLVQGGVNRATAYIGQEVVYKLSFYRAVQIWSKVEFLFPDTQGFWTEKLQDNEQQRQKIQTIGGRRYSVTEITMLLYPLSAGKIEIGSGSVQFQADPFTSPVKLESEKIMVKTLPLPEDGKPENFSGLIGNFSIKVEVKEKSAQVDKPITLTVTVSGEGNLQSIQEPSKPLIKDVEAYDPEIKDTFFRTAHGSNGMRTFSYIFVPRKEGALSIGGFETDYFDPKSGKYVIIKTKSIKFEVAPPAGGKSRPSSGARFRGRTDPTRLATDIRHIKPDVTELVEQGRPYYERPLLYIYAAALLFGLALFSAYLRRKRRLMGDRAYMRGIRAGKMAAKRLQSAGKLLEENNKDEFYGELDGALRRYLADRWDIAPSEITKDKIYEKLNSANSQLAQKLSELLYRCDKARFAPVKTGTNEMEQMLNEANSVIQRLEKKL